MVLRAYCKDNSRNFPSVFLFLHAEEELLSNVSIFNETCVKWQRKVARAGTKETYTVSETQFLCVHVRGNFVTNLGS